MLAMFTAGAVSTAEGQLFKKVFGKKSARRHKESKDTDGGEEKKESRRSRKKHKKEERRKEKEERKKKGKKKKDRKDEPAKKSGSRKNSGNLFAQSKKRHDVNYPKSQYKDRYRVSVLAPLYLDELVSGEGVTFKDKMPEKAQAGVGFYQGVKLAADSLRRAGFGLDIYIHDITTFTESPEMLINNRRFDSTDLIIGAVQSKEIAPLAAYARKRRINFVSVLSPSDGNVKDNPYFTMVQPTLKSHCEWVSADITKKFPKQKVVILYRTSVQADANARTYFTNEIEGEADISELQCNTIPSKEQLLSVFDSTRPNVVIIPVLDIDYADSLLEAVSENFSGTHFEVYGMPTWHGMANIRKPTAYRNLSVNVSHPFNFQSSNELVQRVEADYRKQYAGKPTEYVLRGYETMFWYATLLKKHGTIFNEHYNDTTGVPFTKFKVIPQFDKRGYILYHENTHIYLTTFEGGMSRTEE